jgi:hypothetical protein
VLFYRKAENTPTIPETGNSGEGNLEKILQGGFLLIKKLSFFI